MQFYLVPIDLCCSPVLPRRISTLFPYTTLFRSDSMNTIQDWLGKLHSADGSDLFVVVGAPPCIKVHGKIRPITDRKSTRLNSSHVAISYAVFCLKKNKHTA